MWYKFKFLNYRDSKEIFGTFRILFRITVMVPYKILFMKHGPPKFVAQKPGIFKVCEMAVTYGIIYYAQYLRYSYIDPNDFVSYYGVVTQYNVLSFVACASTLSFLFTHRHFVNSVDLLSKADKGLRALGIDISYNYWFLLSCSYAGTIVFVPIMLNATPRTWTKTFIDLVAFHHPVIIRFSTMSKPVMTMGMLYEHFLKLNQQLEKLLDDDIDDDDDSLGKVGVFKNNEMNGDYLEPEFILDTTTTVHANLVEATKELNTGFSFIIFLNAASNITQVVLALLFIYAGNYKEVSPLELTISFTLYTIQMGVLYLLGHLIQEEAKNTLTSLGHFNAYYLAKDLALKKNTLLLQGKHNKIDLRVMSAIPLNLSIFGRQISICSTLFLIVLQFYRKSQSN